MRLWQGFWVLFFSFFFFFLVFGFEFLFPSESVDLNCLLQVFFFLVYVLLDLFVFFLS